MTTPNRIACCDLTPTSITPGKDGYKDRDGYWAPVELWHPEAEHWQTLFQKGMCGLIDGRTVREE